MGSILNISKTNQDASFFLTDTFYHVKNFKYLIEALRKMYYLYLLDHQSI